MGDKHSGQNRPMSDDTDAHTDAHADADIAGAFETQRRWCARLDSPFYAGLMDWAAADWRAGGAVREALPGWRGDPVRDLVALRLAGALHALVLGGRAPALAALWPPHREAFDPVQAGTAASQALRDNRQHVAEVLASAPQTNEVGRSAALLGGLARVAQRTGLPLAVREIGASAGLNLLWHRYGYALGTQRWGDPASGVRIESDWRGAAPALPPRIDLLDSAGSDLAPIELRDEAAAQRLAAYVWPDQQARLQRLQAAIALARAEGLAVERAEAADWVERVLQARPAGAATVLMHTIVWQYLPRETQARIEQALQRHGARADDSRPLAWLRLEHAHGEAAAALQLTLWPGSESHTLATSHPHGAWVDWQD